MTIDWKPPVTPNCIEQYNISSTSECTIGDLTTNIYYSPPSNSIFYHETCESANYFDSFLVSLDGASGPGPEVFFHLGGTCFITYIYRHDGFQLSISH